MPSLSVVRGHGKLGGRACTLWPALRDRLEASIEAKPLGAIDMMVAEDGVAPAPETVEGHGHRDRHVDPDHAHLDLRGKTAGDGTAAGEHRSAVRKLMRVDQ